MGFGDGAHQAEAEPGAGTRALTVQPREAFEHGGPFIRRHPGPTIGNGDG